VRGAFLAPASSFDRDGASPVFILKKCGLKRYEPERYSAGPHALQLLQRLFSLCLPIRKICCAFMALQRKAAAIALFYWESPKNMI
jgi:hypothetical protein